MRRLRVAVAAALCCGGTWMAFWNLPLAADEKADGKRDELVERQYNVAALIASAEATDELTELCTALVEPTSWEQAGGTGTIKVGRRTMTVKNTAAVGDRIAALIGGLSKLPPLDAKSAADAPKSPRVDVATVIRAAAVRKARDGDRSPARKNEKNEAATKLVLYPVGDLVWIGDKSPPDFESLAFLIVSTVAPESWQEFGGDGGIKSFAGRGTLVVHNTAEAVATIDALLAAIRKLPKMSAALKKPAVVATIPLGKNLGAKHDAEARLYHVADLATAGGGSANFNPIMQRLMDDVATESWQRNGGGGMIFKLLDRGGLAIINTPQAHRAIEAELAKMRTELATPSEPKRGSKAAPKPANGPARTGK
ncbi:MAG: hypothetical protein WD875_09130 [Pirellulales bacterium]